jgi:hypothetical protein
MLGLREQTDSPSGISVRSIGFLGWLALAVRIYSACSIRRVPIGRSLRVHSYLTNCLLAVRLEGDICSQDLIS